MIVRQLRTELVRTIVDRAVRGSVVFATLLGISVVFVIPDGLSQAPREVTEALFAGLRTTVVSNGVLLSAVYGSFRLTSELSSGVVSRQLMYSRRITLYLCRGSFALIGGAAIGAAGCAAGQATFWLAARRWEVDLGLVWAAAVLGVVSAAWGFGLGAAIGNHFAALFIVPLSLAAAIPIASINQDLARVTPFGCQLALIDTDSGLWLDPSNGVWLAVAWGIMAVVVGGVVFRLRDVR
ncbi:hypothetical protein B0H03_101461 [Rathayibacter iranicus NCPPB 2253 = VKM Ac-1602]|uniref:ABC transporter permease n=1 Tax=Rathayibacter iranicus NCPPB 2253 = VKM Ac-1602 TaxID=1328868 RepID=A0ABX5LHQ4_9MICO|nr:hypothetical protein B0H03_101461 [Rathayibacter iranicus NCPPB 2253 = VKM Ac-1602]